MGTDTANIAILTGRGGTDIVAYFRAVNRDSFLTMVKFAFGIYLGFFLFDMMLLPHLWLHFLAVRLLVFVPAMLCLILVERRVVPFNFQAELMFFVPVTWANAYAVTKVPQEMCLEEASLVLLLILPVAAITSWATRQFVFYAALVLTGSIILWHLSGNLAASDLGTVYGLTVPGILAGFLVVQTRRRTELKRFRAETQLVQHEMARVQTARLDIETRLQEAERQAFLALHLESFLAEINEAVMLSDLVVHSGPSENQVHSDTLASFEMVCRQIIKRIEGYLSATSGLKAQKPSFVGVELRSILPLLQFEVAKAGFLLTNSVDANLDSVAVDSGSEKLSVIVFRLMRLAIDSLRQARTKYPGPSFVGKISLDVALLATAVQVTVQENGLGISTAHLADMEELGLVLGVTDGERDTEALTYSIFRQPRLGGGSVVTLKLPIISPANHEEEYRSAKAS